MAGLFKGKLLLQSPGNSKKAKRNKILTYAFRFLVGFVLLRGVISIVSPSHAAIVNNKVPEVISDSAQSFAQAFAQAYFTFERSKAEAYQQSLVPYISKSLLTENAGLDIRGARSNYKVLRTIPWNVSQVNDSQSDVVVRVEIEEKKENNELSTFYRYLSVPITWTGQGFYVHDHPSIVPNPTKADGPISAPVSGNVPDNLHKTINDTLDDFFKAYGNAPAAQLKYYMSDGKEINGYEGALSYAGMKSLAVRDDTNKSKDESKPIDQVRANTETEWKDASGLTYRQHLTITLKYKEERWYIAKIEGGFK
ncbi:conjugal transfer protein [Paenibacillus elgii]|uniref:conjugal transfer protein n=1 Tax=Paenibacillus elgii TaxID=189691 RepID=UPI000A4115E7|nr:conjugal transfer protein [Paenibacillus elgii]